MGKIVSAITADGSIICHGIDSTDIVGEMEQLHKTSAVVTAAIGRLLTAASIMGSQMKTEGESLTLRIKGGGPVGELIAVSDYEGNVRGYVANPVVEIPLNPRGKLDVGGAVGKAGQLTVIRDIGTGEPYNGSIELVSGEIAEDITAYYAYSEQIPTVCALGVLVNPDLTVKASGGFIAQLLPNAASEAIDQLEQNISALSSVTDMLTEGLTIKDIVLKVLNGMEPSIINEKEAEYRCNCSRERVEKALVSIGKEDMQSLIDDEEDTEVSCHFCNKTYDFTKEQLKQLLKLAK